MLSQGSGSCDRAPSSMPSGAMPRLPPHRAVRGIRSCPHRLRLDHPDREHGCGRNGHGCREEPPCSRGLSTNRITNDAGEDGRAAGRGHRAECHADAGHTRKEQKLVTRRRGPADHEKMQVLHTVFAMGTGDQEQYDRSERRSRPRDGERGSLLRSQRLRRPARAEQEGSREDRIQTPVSGPVLGRVQLNRRPQSPPPRTGIRNRGTR